MPRFCVFAVIAMLGSPAIAQSPATTSDLAFLAGCWRSERNGRIVEEHWLAPAGGSLFGVSRTVAGGKTVDFEFLQLRDRPDGLTYIAKPARQPEASFRMTTKTADEVVFENAQHDFPQRIRYHRSGNALHARIEGTVNGKASVIDFPYVRVSCTP